MHKFVKMYHVNKAKLMDKNRIKSRFVEDMNTLVINKFPYFEELTEEDYLHNTISEVYNLTGCTF